MNVVFIHPAEQELTDAFHYYYDQLPELAERFIKEFNQTVKLITEYPNIWTQTGPRTRKARLKRFPYLIFYIYIPGNDIIHITCVAHQHRDPEYFSDRINQ